MPGRLGEPHARQVQVDTAPAAAAGDDWLEGPGHQAVVRSEPVQQHQGPLRVARAVLDVVDEHSGGIDVRHVREAIKLR